VESELALEADDAKLPAWHGTATAQNKATQVRRKGDNIIWLLLDKGMAKAASITLRETPASRRTTSRHNSLQMRDPQSVKRLTSAARRLQLSAR